MSTMQCEVLGQVNFVSSEGGQHYYHTQFSVPSDVMQQFQMMASCHEGVDSVERTNHAGATFVITLKPETLVIDGAANDVCNGLIMRLIKWIVRREQQSMMGKHPELFDGMAVYSEPSQRWGD